MKRPVNKRAMIFTQDEVETLKNLIRISKDMVQRSLKGEFRGNEFKDLETALNAFGRATTWDNEKVLDPKVK
jgi:hypothetical protein